jgi:hypothetical protein
MNRKITVHGFRTYDIVTDGMMVSRRKATEAVIADLPGAELIIGTAEEVNFGELGEDGRFPAS